MSYLDLGYNRLRTVKLPFDKYKAVPFIKISLIGNELGKIWPIWPVDWHDHDLEDLKNADPNIQEDDDASEQEMDQELEKEEEHQQDVDASMAEKTEGSLKSKSQKTA